MRRPLNLKSTQNRQLLIVLIELSEQRKGSILSNLQCNVVLIVQFWAGWGVHALYDEGKSEYNFGYHPKNHRSSLGHTLGDQNQPLFKSPCGSP